MWESPPRRSISTEWFLRGPRAKAPEASIHNGSLCSFLRRRQNNDNDITAARNISPPTTAPTIAPIDVVLPELLEESLVLEEPLEVVADGNGASVDEGDVD